MTPAIAGGILLAIEALALRFIWRNRALLAYVLLAQFPFLILFVTTGRMLNVGLGAVYVSLWHIALGIAVFRRAVPRFGRRWLTLSGVMAAACAVALFARSDSGTVERYLGEYWTVTSAVIAAAVLSFLGIVFGSWRGFREAQWNAAITFVWFGGEVLIAPAYRALTGASYGAEWSRLFVIDCALHAACMLAWIALYATAPRSAREPRSVIHPRDSAGRESRDPLRRA